MTSLIVKAIPLLNPTFPKMSQAVKEYSAPTFLGKKYTHWSMGVAVTGSLVGIITLIAAYIFTDKVYLALGCALLLSNTISFIYLRKFVPLASLDSYIGELKLKISDLESQVTELQKISNEYKEANKDFDIEIERAQKQSEDYFKQLNDKIAELLSVSRQLAITERKLETIQRLYEKLKSATSAMSREVVKFNEDDKAFHAGVHALEDQSAKIGALENKFGTDAAALKATGVEYKKDNLQVSAIVTQLKQQIVFLQKLHGNINSERESLQQKVEKLEHVTDRVDTSATEIENVADRISSASDNFKRNLEDYEEIDSLSRKATDLTNLLHIYKPDEHKGPATAIATKAKT
jgi:chromosome segregation ATPase